MANRTLVLVDADGNVEWSYEAPSPGDAPGANIIFDALAAVVPDLTSASVPPVGPDDHVRGEGETLIVYADLGCPHCAAAWPEIAARPARLVFRHFPLAAKRPRSPALHAAAEAAGSQGRFFEMVDSLFADRGQIDDPHLWERAERARARPRALRGRPPLRRGRRSAFGGTSSPASAPVSPAPPRSSQPGAHEPTPPSWQSA